MCLSGTPVCLWGKSPNREGENGRVHSSTALMKSWPGARGLRRQRYLCPPAGKTGRADTGIPCSAVKHSQGLIFRVVATWSSRSRTFCASLEMTVRSGLSESAWPS